MSEHTLKKRHNGKLFLLQALCRAVDIKSWRMRFQRTLTSNVRQVDMYVVNKLDEKASIVSIGVAHGDQNSPAFFQQLFDGIIPALAGSILLLDIYDTLVELEDDWDNPTLRGKVREQIAVIQKAVATHD